LDCQLSMLIAHTLGPSRVKRRYRNVGSEENVTKRGVLAFIC
jgi:hypothetical protein